MKRNIFILLGLLAWLSVSAQSLTIFEPLKPIENSSVLDKYYNQFGKWNIYHGLCLVLLPKVNSYFVKTNVE